MAYDPQDTKVHSIELSSYVAPEIEEDNKHDWILYGENDAYFDYVIDCYQKSPTNNSILGSMARKTFGKGLSATNARERAGQWAALVAIMRPKELQAAALDRAIFGSFAFEVIYKKDKKTIDKVYHVPYNTVRAGKCNDKGEITHYYISSKWDEADEDPNFNPDRIEAFDPNADKPTAAKELYVHRSYSPGVFYYCPVPYQGGLKYAELEWRISQYYLNLVSKNFTPTHLVNYNNGVPNEVEDRQNIVRKTKQAMSGGDGDTILVSFNSSKDEAAEIITLQVTDAAQQYQELTKQAQDKIMISHGVVSGMLYGVKENTGLGNNAEELKNAWNVEDNSVIRPMQEDLIQAIECFASHNGIAGLDLYFKPLTPIEFVDTDKVQSEEEVIKETGDEEATNVQMHKHEAREMTAEEEKTLLDELIELGEEVDESEYQILDVRPYDPNAEEDFNQALNEANVELARVVYGKPNTQSDQDTSLFKVRYRYAGTTSSRSREFCQKMSKANRVYREEDIRSAGNKQVNPGFGENGASTYSIWFWKGGPRCRHYWERVVYLRRSNRKISVNEARRMILALEPSERKDAKWERNDKRVATRPTDMPNEGFKNPPR